MKGRVLKNSGVEGVQTVDKLSSEQNELHHHSYKFAHMTQEQFSSPQDSLQFIESMINKAKNRFNENGHLYLLWGWVIFCCSVLHFILSYWNISKNPQFVWMFTWVALIYQSVYIARRKKTVRVKTYMDEMIGSVWFVFVMLMLLTGFITGKAGAWNIMYPLFLVLYGVPTFLTGAFIKFMPLQVGAACCWLLALASGFVPYQYQVLFISLAVICAWVIPGYLLRSRFKKQN